MRYWRDKSELQTEKLLHCSVARERMFPLRTFEDELQVEGAVQKKQREIERKKIERMKGIEKERGKKEKGENLEWASE